MKCIVTAGPTYEPLDEVRRLTNFSTGRLGVGLAEYLARQGHESILLLGSCSLIRGGQGVARQEFFTTTADLRKRLECLADHSIGAVFHAAAVSDFRFGKVWHRCPEGALEEVSSSKFSTRQGTLLAELVPTPKLIMSLRDWFPRAIIAGWKYEVEGDRRNAIANAIQQLHDSRTNICVANGPAYGAGFGVVTGVEACLHLADAAALYGALSEHLKL